MYGYETPNDRQGRNVHEINKLKGFERGHKSDKKKLHKEVKVQKYFYPLLW